MTGIVKIGDIEVGMSALASSPIRYKQVFRKDFLQEIKKGEESDTYAYVEMGYIMARAYEHADMNSLSYDDYITWLDQFGQGDMITAVSKIVELWGQSSVTTSASGSKKKSVRQ